MVVGQRDRISTYLLGLISPSAAVDLVQSGKVDEAERAARDLLVRFPDVHDSYDRLGIIYEARGERIKAAECYRKVIEFDRGDPDHHHPLRSSHWCRRFNEPINI